MRAERTARRSARRLPPGAVLHRWRCAVVHCSARGTLAPHAGGAGRQHRCRGSGTGACSHHTASPLSPQQCLAADIQPPPHPLLLLLCSGTAAERSRWCGPLDAGRERPTGIPSPSRTPRPPALPCRAPSVPLVPCSGVRDCEPPRQRLRRKGPALRQRPPCPPLLDRGRRPAVRVLSGPRPTRSESCQRDVGPGR